MYFFFFLWKKTEEYIFKLRHHKLDCSSIWKENENQRRGETTCSCVVDLKRCYWWGDPEGLLRIFHAANVDGAKTGKNTPSNVKRICKEVMCSGCEKTFQDILTQMEMLRLANKMVNIEMVMNGLECHVKEFKLYLNRLRRILSNCTIRLF